MPTARPRAVESVGEGREFEYLLGIGAHDAVLELDAQTLCFDLPETQALLRKHQSTVSLQPGSPAPLGPDDAAQLHQMTLAGSPRFVRRCSVRESTVV